MRFVTTSLFFLFLYILPLARDEWDVNAPVEAKVIEEHFTREGVLLNVHVGGEVIQTTPEHPFYVRGQGWTPAGQLAIGDELSTHTGAWIAIDDLFDTGETSIVYNFRVQRKGDILLYC